MSYKSCPMAGKLKKTEVFAKKNLLNTYIPLTFPKYIIKKNYNRP